MFILFMLIQEIRCYLYLHFLTFFDQSSQIADLKIILSGLIFKFYLLTYKKYKDNYCNIKI